MLVASILMIFAVLGGLMGHIFYVDSRGMLYWEFDRFDVLKHVGAVILGALIGIVFVLLSIVFIAWLFSACGVDSDTEVIWMVGPNGQFFWGLR